MSVQPPSGQEAITTAKQRVSGIVAQLQRVGYEGPATLKDYLEALDALISAVRESQQAEIDRLTERATKAETAARVGIEGDNHHNAACCPYCQPELEKQVARHRELIQRAEAAESRCPQPRTEQTNEP